MTGAESQSIRNKISILYVDDENELLTITKFYLEDSGEFNVDILSSAEEALESSPIQSYDAIVSDYKMPDMNGISFLKAVRKKYGDIPFILFMGEGSEEILIEAINNGADFYLQKGKNPVPMFAELAYGIKQAVKKKRAEDALKKSEEKFRSFVENANEILFSMAPDGSFLYVSPNVTDLLGYDLPEVMNMSAAFFIHPDDLPRNRELFKKSLSTGENKAGFEYRLRHKNGTWRWYSMNLSPVVDEHGSIIATQGICHDITYLKNIEKDLRESEEKFRSFVENANDIIYSLALDGTFTYVSPKWTEILGYEFHDTIGKLYDIYIHPDDLPRCQQFVRDTITSGEKRNGIEYRIRHKDGTWQWHTTTASLIRDAAGNTIQFLGICRDITQRKQSEDALKKANRQLNLLTSITRHDILNGIMVIFSYLDFAETDFPDPILSEYIRKMRWATKEIQSQIELTRIYEELGSNETRWIRLDSIMPRSSIPESIILTVDIQDLSIFADPMLSKVFFNLWDNSIRHGQRVTQIRVSAYEYGSDMILVWEDNGVGIADEEKSKIFERGFGKNTGLGMFLVREILSLTNITIKETGMQWTGARFEIIVPEGGWRREGG